MRLEDLSKADRFCPNPTQDPYWNESAWFSFSIPERKFHGLIYYFFRPNMNLLVGGPAIWDPSGCHSWNCLYHDWQHIQAIPAGAQKYDFVAPNSLSVQVVEPVRKYRIRYDKLGCQIELEWNAIADANEFAMEEHAYGASTESRFHIEQAGRVKGVVRLRGETYQIDCFSLRDCSYGRRVLGTTLKGGYFWGITDEKSAFHTQTKGEYGEEQVVGGFLLSEGVMGDLVSGTRRIIEAGRYTPAAWVLDAKDNLGREIKAICRTHSDLLFTGYPDIAITWSLLEVEFDGKKGWGDSQEFYPREDFRQRLRATL
jgi:hypothetical protein